jgi:hypothetical protein
MNIFSIIQYILGFQSTASACVKSLVDYNHYFSGWFILERFNVASLYAYIVMVVLFTVGFVRIQDQSKHPPIKSLHSLISAIEKVKQWNFSVEIVRFSMFLLLLALLINAFVFKEAVWEYFAKFNMEPISKNIVHHFDDKNPFLILALFMRRAFVVHIVLGVLYIAYMIIDMCITLVTWFFHERKFSQQAKIELKRNLIYLIIFSVLLAVFVVFYYHMMGMSIMFYDYKC